MNKCKGYSKSCFWQYYRRTARLAVIGLFPAPPSAVPFPAAFAQTQTAPALSSAASFAILAGPAVTCTDSTITGDVGIFSPVPPGSLLTQTNCTINGTIHAGDASAVTAYNDFLSAYDALQALPATSCDQVLTGTLAGVTLTPGVYCFDAAATLTGQLTLDAQGDPNAVWIFKIGTSGTGALTGTSFSVVMANGGQPCNVYWWTAEAATMTDSNFQGTILAGVAITVTRETFNGDALAQAAVTLTGATLTGCQATGGNVHGKCNQGVGNGPEGCDPGNSNQGDPSRSNDELGGTPGNPGREGGNGK